MTPYREQGFAHNIDSIMFVKKTWLVVQSQLGILILCRRTGYKGLSHLELEKTLVHSIFHWVTPVRTEYDNKHLTSWVFAGVGLATFLWLKAKKNREFIPETRDMTVRELSLEAFRWWREQGWDQSLLPEMVWLPFGLGVNLSHPELILLLNFPN